MLQPLREVVQRLERGGVTGTDLLRTFFSHRVQVLRQREMSIWTYPGPGCPGRPFSKELCDTEKPSGDATGCSGSSWAGEGGGMG
jgi:hypothetical protein